MGRKHYLSTDNKNLMLVVPPFLRRDMLNTRLAKVLKWTFPIWILPAFTIVAVSVPLFIAANILVDFVDDIRHWSE